jgi:putative ubiquitin-RnfH superfamily antitoxin RatB of RatAB toxin-antitoxin module
VTDPIEIELVYASATRQRLLSIQADAGATVAAVLSQSDIDLDFPDENIDDLAVGIWGKLVDRDHIVRDGDRIELYRPLQIDPREARRQLALAGRTMGTGADG